jgi:hypothetical protein
MSGSSRLFCCLCAISVGLASCVPVQRVSQVEVRHSGRAAQFNLIGQHAAGTYQVFAVNLGEWDGEPHVEWLPPSGWTLQSDGSYFAFSAIHEDDGSFWYSSAYDYSISIAFYDGPLSNGNCTGNVIWTATYLSGRIVYPDHDDNLKNSGIDTGAAARVYQMQCAITTRTLTP